MEQRYTVPAEPCSNYRPVSKTTNCELNFGVAHYTVSGFLGGFNPVCLGLPSECMADGGSHGNFPLSLPSLYFCSDGW